MSQHIHALIKNLYTKITNMTRRCVLTKTTKDENNYQVVQVQYLGKIANVEALSLYGFSCNPPVGSTGTMWTVLGDEENRLAFFNLPQKRFKNLKPGEVQHGNPLTRSSIKYDEEGNITITSTKDIIIESANKVTIEATTVEIVADVTITGKLTVSDDVIAGTISSKDHIHSGVTSGGESSGPPVP